MAQSNTGKVKFFKKESGFGFIVDDASGEDIFFHVKNCKDSAKLLKQEDEVSFNTQPGKKGLEAMDVALVK